jgi:hypothetical protein
MTELSDALSLETDGERAAIQAAVSRIVFELVHLGLAVLEPAAEGATAAPGAAGAPAKRPFVEPTLETFTDLQDLLTADPIHDVEPPGWPQLLGADGKERR